MSDMRREVGDDGAGGWDEDIRHPERHGNELIYLVTRSGSIVNPSEVLHLIDNANKVVIIPVWSHLGVPNRLIHKISPDDTSSRCAVITMQIRNVPGFGKIVRRERQLDDGWKVGIMEDPPIAAIGEMVINHGAVLQGFSL